jgi:hypothetical protein
MPFALTPRDFADLPPSESPDDYMQRISMVGPKGAANLADSGDNSLAHAMYMAQYLKEVGASPEEIQERTSQLFQRKNPNYTDVYQEPDQNWRGNLSDDSAKIKRAGGTLHQMTDGPPPPEPAQPPSLEELRLGGNPLKPWRPSLPTRQPPPPPPPPEQPQPEVFEPSIFGRLFPGTGNEQTQPPPPGEGNGPPLPPRLANPTVGDYLDHPELYKAYPDLAQIPVHLQPNGKNFDNRGGYDPDRNSITLNSQMPRDQLKHEILQQLARAIQKREGFAISPPMANRNKPWRHE